MSLDIPQTVRVTYLFSATPERVFDAWLDPSKASRWLFATSAGQNVRADIDARPGGRFTIVDRRDGEDVEHVGEYLEVDRPRRLVFRFAVPKYSDKTTRVTVEIVPRVTGCELTLMHEGVPGEHIVRTESGWTTMLKGLDAFLNAHARG